MKWLIVIPRYLPEYFGGNVTYTKLLAENLLKAGHEVQIITTTKSKKLSSFEIINGLKIHRLFTSYGNMGPIYFNYTNKITNYIIDLDLKENFDCINTQASFLIDYKKIRKNLFIISTCHAVISYEYFYRLKEQIIQNFNIYTLKDLMLFPINLILHYIRELSTMNKAHSIVVMSHYVKNHVCKFFPFLNSKKIHISRIGFDNEFLIPENKDETRNKFDINNQDICIFTVRRLEPRMGLQNLIDAVKILIKEYNFNNIKLYIAGKGQLNNKLKEQIDKLELSQNIFLLGYVSDDDLIKWYKAADLFVMPTKELEGFGIAALQALGVGLPVVSTKAGANKELTGRYYPELLTETVNQPTHLAESINKWLNNRNNFNYDDISKKVRQDYSWEKIVNELTTITDK
jgi:glycosyltransferase involved in cell wall biosynthesis